MSVYENLVGMEEVLDEFAIETAELLEGINEDLVNLESGSDPDLVNRVFRAFHTIKGTCGFLGFIQAKDVAHVAEDLLNQLRNGEIRPNGGMIDVLLESSDWFGNFRPSPCWSVYGQPTTDRRQSRKQPRPSQQNRLSKTSP
jgi:two-component system chemotaxis sensor kinase CheA